MGCQLLSPGSKSNRKFWKSRRREREREKERKGEKEREERGIHKYTHTLAQLGLLANLVENQGFVTPANVIDIFRENDVPNDFDLLSLDTDGFEWLLWLKLQEAPL